LATQTQPFLAVFVPSAVPALDCVHRFVLHFVPFPLSVFVHRPLPRFVPGFSWCDPWCLIVRSMEAREAHVESGEHLIERLLWKVPANIQTQAGLEGLECEPDEEWTVTSHHAAHL
jgi:hypothetical protein